MVWLTVRRFFCDHVDCSASTFVEQIPGLTERHARRSVVLQGALVAIGLALAGRAGARLAATLGMGGEPVDATAADPSAAGSAGRSGGGARCG